LGGYCSGVRGRRVALAIFIGLSVKSIASYGKAAGVGRAGRVGKARLERDTYRACGEFPGVSGGGGVLRLRKKG